MAGKLLAAALSESIGAPVVTYDQYLKEKDSGVQFQELTDNEIFGFSHPRERSSAGSDAKPHTTIDPRQPLVSPRQWMGLISLYGQKVFEGKNIMKTNPLGTTKLGQMIRQIFDRAVGRPRRKYYIDDRSLLDEKYDYDFTNVWDDGTEYYRGGKPYYPPYGWKRFGFNVLGKYDDDDWLGEYRNRTESTPGEWPVAYHGLQDHSVWPSIARGGYDLGRSKRALFGRGIYSAPSIEVAEHFAKPFKVDGVTYKLVFQNRVSTEGLEIVPADTPGAVGEYWVQPNDQLIRPYGLWCLEPPHPAE